LFLGKHHSKILPPLLVCRHQTPELLALLCIQGQGIAKVLNRQGRPGWSSATAVHVLTSPVNEDADDRQIKGEGKDQEVEKPGALSGLFSFSYPFKV
jgi:hypothetical protein